MALKVVRTKRPAGSASSGSVLAGPTTTATTTTSLADLRPAQRATITCLDDTHPRLARRLFDLGFAPGADVEVVRVAPLADPIIVRVADYELAMRRAEARQISVELHPAVSPVRRAG